MTQSANVCTTGSQPAGSSVFEAPPRRSMPIGLATAFGAAVLVAAVLYQPWVNTPFDILDFSDFLAILRRSDSFAQRLSEFVRHYASQGRFNLLNYAFLVLKWSLFGWNESAWQMARSAQMLSIVVGVYVLLRRLGAGRSGSIAGAALFIVAQTASPAWIRLPMGEPLGLMASLGAAHIATSYQGTPRWRAAGVGIAALLTATVLTKELLIVLVPFVLLLACARHSSGEIERPRLTRRNIWLASLTSLGMLVVGTPVTMIALRAPPAAYSSDYGGGALSLGHFLYTFLSIMLPVRGLFDGQISLSLQLGNLLFLVVALAGWILALGDTKAWHLWLPAGIAATALAVAASIVYLPLPYFQDYYGLPFVLAPAILLAIAITAIERRVRAWRWVAYLACAVTVTQAALYAAHDSRGTIAARKIHRELVDDFAAHSTADSIVVMVRRVETERWKRRGPTLGRYASAVLPGQHFPKLVDSPCSVIRATLDGNVGNSMVVSHSSQCGSINGRGRSIRYDYTYLGWPSLKPERDSLVISIVGPESQKK